MALYLIVTWEKLSSSRWGLSSSKQGVLEIKRTCLSHHRFHWGPSSTGSSGGLRWPPACSVLSPSPKFKVELLVLPFAPPQNLRII